MHAGRLLPRRLGAICNVLFYNTQKENNRNILYVKQFHVITPRTMAQRTITSFFNVTPLKKASIKKETGEEKDADETNVKDPISNGTDKKPAKRSRITSSESETETKSLEIKNEKKKKVKRQRIESSGSDSEPTKSENELEKSKSKEPSTSPVTKKSMSEEDSPSENKSPIKNIKVEKSENPKTYQSPKGKKQKFKNSAEIMSPKVDSKESAAQKELTKDESPETNKENRVKSEKDEKIEVTEIVPEAEYDPSLTKYHPIKHACWRAGEPVPYLALARTLELIEATKSRLRIVDILANYLRSVIALTPEDLLPSVYMCLNQLAPAYHSLELGIAESYLLRAVCASTGRSAAQLRAAARALGDLGAAAAAARAAQRTMFAAPRLLLARVFRDLTALARMTGHASVNKKIAKIQTLFVACRHSEAKYLIRSLEGKLRIGLAEQSVLQALAQAATLTPPPLQGQDIVLDASKGVPADVFKARVDANALTIKTTYCECPDYGRLVPALLEAGVDALPQRCPLAVGTPLKPMLAHPTRGVQDIFTRFEGSTFTCEWKYDGERAQLHLPSAAAGGPDFARAAVFSRSQEDTTSKYPDVVARLPALLAATVRSCVLDCEVVAVDKPSAAILPFQVLATRKRKTAAADVKVAVCVFVFDLLLLNGEPLVRRPLAARRDLLREHFREVPGEWQFAKSKDCTDVEEVQQFLEEAVKGSCEGLMVKTLLGDNARYDIARRSHNWLKLKKDYLSGVGDSLDVAIIGAYRGRGRRRGALGAFLAAVWEPQRERFQALCKLGTGFSDGDLAQLSRQLERLAIDAPKSYYDVDRAHTPDVWLSPSHVWEVRCADLSLSPSHRAAVGLVDPHRGISLRFPRFIRVREDKAPEQATTAQQVADLYLAQDQLRSRPPPKQDVDDFY